MTDDKTDLRDRAEEKVGHSSGDLDTLPPEETGQKLHELRVHQVELEMQNEELRRTRERLEAAQELYFGLYNLAPVGYCIASEEGIILEANLTALTLLGVARSELVKQPISRFILNDDKKIYDLYRKKFLETHSAGDGCAGKSQACELRMIKKSGRPFWARLEASAAQGADGAPVHCFVLKDITGRKRSEAYREMGREVLQILNEPRDLQDSIQRVLAVLMTQTGFDAVGIRLQYGDDFPYFVQKGLPKDFLLTENTLIERGADGSACRDKDGNARLKCTCGLVLSGKTDPANPLFTAGGSFWTNDSFPILDLPPGSDPRLNPRNQCIHQGYASVALVPIRDKNKIVGLIQINDRRKGSFTLETVEILEGIAAHIGAALMRKRDEEELRVSEARLNKTQEISHLGSWEFDIPKGQLTWSDEVYRIMGVLPRGFVITLEAFFDSVHPEDRDSVSSGFFGSIQEGNNSFEIEHRVIRKLTGEVRYVIEKCEHVRDASGKIVRSLGMVHDITDRKRVEAALHERKQFLHSTIDGLSAHICVIDAQGNIVITNLAWNIFSAENGSAEGAFGEGCNYLGACRTTSENERFNVEESAAGIRAVIAGTLPEYVTEYPCHSPDEQRWFICRVHPLKVSGANFVVISHENITERVLAEEALRASEAHYRLLTEDVSDVVWKLDRDYRYTYISPADQRLRGYPPEEVIGLTVFEHLTEEGITSIREVIQQRQEAERLGTPLDTMTFEVQQRGRNGAAIWMEILSSAERDGQGAITGYHGISRDITDRKLANQSRLTAMAAMVSAIAHQWRQPLATLGMIIQRTHAVGTMQGLTPEQLDEFKANALRQIRYMSDTIDEFSGFYRPGKLNVLFSPFNCITDAVRLFEPQFSSSGIVVDVQCSGCDEQLAKGIPNEFKQVILNLLGNARDAILESRNTKGQPQEGRIRVQISVSGESAITIHISDNGCGIPADVTPKIFDPNFSSKQASGGSGLGLYMSRMIVEDCLGGHLSLIQGQVGATFRIELPLEKSS